MADPERKQMIEVLAAGAIGGACLWLFQLWMKTGITVHTLIDPLISIALGAAASFVFVYLIANTDREDRQRLLALAFVGGFSWLPVLNAAKGMVQGYAEQNRFVQASDNLDSAIALAEQLPGASEDQKTRLTAELLAEVESAQTTVSKIDSHERRQALSKSLHQLQDSLERNTPAAPPEAIEPVRGALGHLQLTIDPADAMVMRDPSVRPPAIRDPSHERGEGDLRERAPATRDRGDLQPDRGPAVRDRGDLEPDRGPAVRDRGDG